MCTCRSMADALIAGWIDHADTARCKAVRKPAKIAGKDRHRHCDDGRKKAVVRVRPHPLNKPIAAWRQQLRNHNPKEQASADGNARDHHDCAVTATGTHLLLDLAGRSTGVLSASRGGRQLPDSNQKSPAASTKSIIVRAALLSRIQCPPKHCEHTFSASTNQKNCGCRAVLAWPVVRARAYWHTSAPGVPSRAWSERGEGGRIATRRHQPRTRLGYFSAPGYIASVRVGQPR